MRETYRRRPVLSDISSQNLRREWRWTQSRIRHHNPRVSCGGSSALGARPSATTSTDQGTDAARASSEEHIDGDAAMGGNSAHDDSARRGSRRRENHAKSELSNQAPLNSTFREGSSGRRLFMDIQLPSLRKRHWTGPVRKQ